MYFNGDRNFWFKGAVGTVTVHEGFLTVDPDPGSGTGATQRNRLGFTGSQDCLQTVLIPGHFFQFGKGIEPDAMNGTGRQTFRHGGKELNDPGRAEELQGILHYAGHILKDRRIPGTSERGPVDVDDFSNIGDRCVRFPIAFDVFPEPTGNTCASSDYFVGIENFSSPEIESFRNEFECMDMESFALATICSELGIRFCAVKCISDGADKTMSNFDEDLPRFKAVIDEFVKSLE